MRTRTDLPVAPNCFVPGVMEDAVRQGVISDEEATLIRRTRLGGTSLVDVARERGAAYWGIGTGPHGFDCSGLTMKAWEAAGISIPRVTTDQVNFGASIPLEDLAPGDLLFYDTGGPGAPPAHVTMYVGDGEMVNAPSTGKSIRVEPVDGPYYSTRFMSAARPG